ncbi:MAG: hypothetical protein IPJ94_24720 [Chloroflexi bacterium]|nr:hypothetical protein [Chloroflexota bacterium]
MIVTDASVWVSHLITQEVHHAVSRRWLTAVVHSRSIIAAPALLLAEVGALWPDAPETQHWATRQFNTSYQRLTSAWFTQTLN